MLFILIIFLIILILIIRISFLTLIERFILRLRQNRLGPNKISFLGFIQSFIDGLKLIKKRDSKFLINNINKILRIIILIINLNFYLILF